jgi:uncharacterized protein YkwD
VPRTPVQAIAFLLGLWFALWLSPFGARGASLAQRAEGERRPAVTGAPFAELEAELHRGVNAVRSEQHLIPLERRADLDAVALAHSQDMVARHYLAHESPEGANALNRLDSAHVTGFALAAENIGITDRPDPNHEILRAWLASEVHRTNLFSPPFNATGIGIARAPNGSLVYTQVFVTYPR